MCCENPIDLGCVNSCDNVTTAVALIGTNTYTVRFMFNGVEITRTFTTTGVDGFLEIPAHYFNEGAPVTFALYDSQGTYINCYKFSVSPSVTIAEDTEAVTSLTSSIEYVSETCDAVFTYVTLRVLLSDYTVFTDDALIYFRLNKSIPSEARFADAAGSSLSIGVGTNYFTIPNAASITASNMLIKLLVANANCLNDIAIEISVLNYDGLIDGVSVGANHNLQFTTQGSN